MAGVSRYFKGGKSGTLCSGASSGHLARRARTFYAVCAVYSAHATPTSRAGDGGDGPGAPHRPAQRRDRRPPAHVRHAGGELLGPAALLARHRARFGHGGQRVDVIDARRARAAMATGAGGAAGGKQAGGKEAGYDAEGQYAEFAVEALGQGGGAAANAGQSRRQDA
jgi:hypothetical protein